MKCGRPPNSDVVAFGGIDRKVPIYRPIQDIVEGPSKRPFCERDETIFTLSAKSSVVTLMTLGWSLANNKKRSGPSTDP